jgi:alpha-glucosidase
MMRAEWWRGATIYQIYPRSFADSNGDGIGDLPGITAHLDYVAQLGVDAVWLSPFFTSPMADYGYDVADYRDVDPIFGTLADFDALLAKAHALGLKVIIDQVYAHTSDAHAWFTESRSSRDNAKAAWYVWAEAKPDGTPPSNWQSVFGGPAWTWDARRGQYFMHNFLKEQPQLNVHNPEVQDALLAAAKFWLDRGVGGFRLDALNFAFHNRALTDNPPVPRGQNEVQVRTRPFDFQLKINNMSQPELLPFVERIRALTDQYENRFTVAEVGGDDAEREMKLLTQGDKRLNTAYSFAFLHQHQPSPALVTDVLSKWPDAPRAGWPSWAFSNHDAPRVVSRWAGATGTDADARLYLMLLLALRGNPFIYQGEELGLPQADVPYERLLDPEAIANWPLTQGRDGARTPLPWTAEAPLAGFSTTEPWLPIDARHVRQSIASQAADADSVLMFTRQMVALRRESAPLKYGSIEFVAAASDTLVFKRAVDGEHLICVFNMSEKAVSYAPGSGYETLIAVNGARAEVADLPAYSGYIARHG